MSDALSEAKDQEKRSQRFEHFLKLAHRYIPNFINESELKKRINIKWRLDMGMSRDLPIGFSNLLNGILSADEKTHRMVWAKLIYSALQSEHLYNLKAISPFADKIMIFNINGERRIVGLDLLSRYPSVVYAFPMVLVLPTPTPDKVETFQFSD